MKKFVQILLVVFTLGIFFLIFYTGSNNLTNNEATLLNILLVLISVAATWIASHYYAEDSYKKAVAEVEKESQSKLKVYALKAAEKVTNLSSELKKLSIYLTDELEQDYEDNKQEIISREEKLQSIKYIVNTLKSINDTSLSDWGGVIGDEIEEKQEEEREREERIYQIVDEYSNIISNKDYYNNINHNFNESIEDIEKIDKLNQKIDLVIKNLDIKNPIIKKKNLKEDIYNVCPECNTQLQYRQRPKQKSVKMFNCEGCNTKLISKWDKDKGFFLETSKIIKEEIECPQCNQIQTINLSNILHSKHEGLCEKCGNLLIVIRKDDDIQIKNHLQYKIEKMENKITPKIIETVKECLPEQPWPTGINKSIAQKLNLSHREVSNIINILIERGDFLMQINGKLYAEKKDQIS